MTQSEAILDYINRYGSISPIEAFEDLGITKLATRISELRKDGHKFKIEYINSINRFGHKIQYAQYSKYVEGEQNV